jgi:sterol desaturase/sphingolipid hydroxylase (fatty acid hydroxylase superfamily)
LGTSYFHDGLTQWFKNLYTNVFQTSFSSINSIIIFIFVILLADFLGYLKHRLEHTLPILWDIHEFHHSATEMTIMSFFRDVPIVDILTFPLLLPFQVFSSLMIYQFLSQGLLVPIYIYIFDQMFETAFLYLGHSSFKVIYPKPLSYILMSPALHWIHHSDNKKHFDKNFSTKYTFWDKMLNSYLDETHIKDITGFGVKNTQYNKYHPLYCYFFLPYKKLTKRIKSGAIFAEKIA